MALLAATGGADTAADDAGASAPSIEPKSSDERLL